MCLYYLKKRPVFIGCWALLERYCLCSPHMWCLCLMAESRVLNAQWLLSLLHWDCLRRAQWLSSSDHHFTRDSLLHVHSFELSQTLEENQCLPDICGLLCVFALMGPSRVPYRERVLVEGFSWCDWAHLGHRALMEALNFIFGIEK